MPPNTAMEDALKSLIKSLMKALEMGMYYPAPTPENISRATLQQMTVKLLGWTKDPTGWYWSKVDQDGVKQKVSIHMPQGVLQVESMESISKQLVFPSL